MKRPNILSIQINPKIGYKDKNIQKIYDLIDANSSMKPDLIVLPEFFNTGVSVPQFEKLAENEFSNETLDFFKNVARKYQSYILVGSIMERQNGKLYNTSRLLDRNGEEIAVYRKMHLFDSFGGDEDKYCTAGEEYVVVDTDFGKIGISVCFDIRFPMHFIELVKRGAEIILEPAAWSAFNDCFQERTENWIMLNRTRAYDNLVYFVSANLCGKVDSCLSSCGHSMIVAPDGVIMSDAGVNEGVAFAQLDMDYLREYRFQFKMENLWKNYEKSGV